MTIGYRTILRLSESESAVLQAETHLEGWLREKLRRPNSANGENDIWAGPGEYDLGEGIHLTVVHDDYGEGSGGRRLYRILQTTPNGVFEVVLIASELPGLGENGQTIVVTVDKKGVREGDSVWEIDPPRFVRSILLSCDVTDGAAPLYGAPKRVQRSDVKGLVSAIRDHRRVASIVVAPSLDDSTEPEWTRILDSLTRQGVGVSSTFVITLDAQEELNRLLGPAHAVARAQVRTFLPNVDLDDPADALRHRVLGPATLARSINHGKVERGLQHRHAERARRRLIDSEVPADVRRTLAILQRAELETKQGARLSKMIAPSGLVGGSPGSANPTISRAHPFDSDEGSLASYLAEVLERWVGAGPLDQSRIQTLDQFIAEKVTSAIVLREQLNETIQTLEEREAELIESRHRLDDLELDLAQAEIDEIENARQLVELRRRLAASPDPDTHVADDPADWEAPANVEELITRLTPGPEGHPILQYVEFTGDVAAALQVDSRYQSGLYGRTLWQYARVLHDYAEQRASGDFNGSLYMYLTDDRVGGTKCSAARFAATESDSVMNNPEWRAERVFPVPPDVNPDGRVLMDAHFKPPHRDTFAPRMHFYDDTSVTGKVYVGYIGRHLRNKQT